MSSSKSILSAVTGIVRKAFGYAGRSRSQQRPGPSRVSERRSGMHGRTATVRMDADRVGRMRITYAPDRDGAPDAGEIIWTWVPFEENDGRGKDRPVLVIARQSEERVYAVRMTSRSREGDRDFVSIGSGAWDAQGRESWVDVEQLYSVHERGMRREAAGLDRRRFRRVAEALGQRYGWTVEA